MNILDSVKSFFRQGTATLIPAKHTRALDPWAAYQAQFPPVLTATKTDPHAQDNVVLPIISEIVNASTAHLLGDGPKIDVLGDGQEAAQEFLAGFLSRSKHQASLRKAALNGAVIGHVFLKLIVENGVPVRFQALNSAMVNVATDPRDCERAVSYIVAWESDNPATHRTDKHREVTERIGAGWLITEEIQRSGSGKWEVVEQTEWPYEWSPVFDAQNLTNPLGYLGLADASDACVAQNQSINVVLSLLSRLLRNHASPKTILNGLNSRSMDWLTDGAVSLPEGVEVSQLQMGAEGAQGLLDLYKSLRAEIHSLSRTPEIASGKIENVGPISGAALQILYKPLESKTAEKRSHLGEMIEDMCERILELAGFAGCTVECVFPNTTPVNVLEQRQTAQADLQMGVASKETIAKAIGYDWEAEKEQMAGEGTDAGTAILSALDRG
jgi:hypothetical protein